MTTARQSLFWVFKMETTGIFADILILDSAYLTEAEAMNRMRELSSLGLWSKFEFQM